VNDLLVNKFEHNQT